MKRYFPYDSSIKYVDEIENFLKKYEDGSPTFDTKLFSLALAVESARLPVSIKCVFPSFCNEKFDPIIQGSYSYLQKFDSFDGEPPIFIIDFSITKNGKSGMAFTEDAFYYHSGMRSTVFYYSDIYFIGIKGKDILINDSALDISMIDTNKVKDIITYCAALYQNTYPEFVSGIEPFASFDKFEDVDDPESEVINHIINQELSVYKSTITCKMLSDEKNKKRIRSFINNFEKGNLPYPSLTWNDIYFFFDSSVTCNGSSGYLLTKKGVFYLNAPAWGKPKRYYYFSYDEIHDLQILENELEYDGENKGIKINSSFIGASCHNIRELYITTKLLTSYHQCVNQ